jgi:hypothetical protein
MSFTGNAMATSFKQEILVGEHNFTNATDVFKMALYGDSATLTAASTIYTTAGELASAGNYTTAGNALDNNLTPTTGGTTAWTDWDDEVWGTATFSAYGAMIYNDTHASDAAVLILDFGGVKTATAGDFTVQFPTPDATNAILRIA